MADANVNKVSMTEKQKVKEITDRLEEGLKELFESEKYKTYLNTMSKFHKYSISNTILIAMQKPDATLVAGYKTWQKNFDRHVKKGETGIRILAPAPYRIKKEQEKFDPVTDEIMLDKNGKPITEEVEIMNFPEVWKIMKTLCRHFRKFLRFLLAMRELDMQRDISIR